MEEKGGWKRFQKLKFDSRKISRRARNAEAATTKHAHRFVIKKLTNLRDVRQSLSLWILIVSALIGALALQMVWFQSGFRTTTQASEGTYAEAVRGEIRTLNPLYAANEAELSASKLIFSNLFDYDNTGHLRKNLVDSIVTDAKKKVYTVTIREDAYWHDGVKLTAEDVQFTVGLMKDPEARALMQSSWSDIKARTLDSKTIQFTLPGSLAPFPHALTFSVLPKHILSDVAPSALRENTFSLSPIGSGPFRLRLLQNVTVGVPHKIVHLSKNNAYYGGQPKLSSFQLHAYKDKKGLLDAVRARDVSAAVDTDTTQQKDIPVGFNVRKTPINSGVYVLFNTKSPLLTDATIRKALQVGTDTLKLKNAKDSQLRSLHLPFLASQLSEQSGLPAQPTYDLPRATDLLKTDGWKKNLTGMLVKKSKPLKLRVAANKESEYRPLLDELARQWKLLGIETEITEFDSSSLDQSFTKTVLQPRDYDVLVHELELGSDPDVFAYWHSSRANTLGLNFSNYTSSVSDDILLSARLRTERSLRDQKYKDFARQWLDEAPAIGVYQPSVKIVQSKQAETIQENSVLPTLRDRYSNVLYWSAERTGVYKTP